VIACGPLRSNVRGKRRYISVRSFVKLNQTLHTFKWEFNQFLIEKSKAKRASHLRIPVHSQRMHVLPHHLSPRNLIYLPSRDDTSQSQPRPLIFTCMCGSSKMHIRDILKSHIQVYHFPIADTADTPRIDQSSPIVSCIKNSRARAYLST
jgi:hypothetical protein